MKPVHVRVATGSISSREDYGETKASISTESRSADPHQSTSSWLDVYSVDAVRDLHAALGAWLERQP